MKMKKIILLLLIAISSFAFAQKKQTISIQNLAYEINSISSSDSVSQLNFKLADSKKSVGLGVIYSLLLPGMGELYANAYDVGKYFTIADGVLWGTFIGMNIYANWQETNYKSYAETRAGISNENKDETYYATISQYSSIDSYNDEKALERNFDEMYDRDFYFWKWNTTEERQEYRDMWTSSEQTRNDTRFIIGGLILNRVASAINAARLVTSYNNRLEEELSWNFSVGFVNRPTLPTSISFNFTANF
jgi:hypothetical protein